MKKNMCWKVLETLSGVTLLVLISGIVVSAQVFQPKSVSAVVGEAIVLPCSFSYPQQMEPIWEWAVWWRINSSDGGYIYRHQKAFTHPDYAGRISFYGSPWREKTASIRIKELRESDSNRYYCGVQGLKDDRSAEGMQSIQGTELKVTVSAQNSTYELFQPESATAVMGGSVILHCFLSYPQKDEPIWELIAYWRINSSDGDYIYRGKEDFTHPDYMGRISVNRNLWVRKVASITIRDLRESDSNRYFCGVERNTGKNESWQSIGGTELTVSGTQTNGQVAFSPRTAVVTPTSTTTSGVDMKGNPGMDVEGKSKMAIPGVDDYQHDDN